MITYKRGRKETGRENKNSQKREAEGDLWQNVIVFSVNLSARNVV